MILENATVDSGIWLVKSNHFDCLALCGAIPTCGLYVFRCFIICMPHVKKPGHFSGLRCEWGPYGFGLEWGKVLSLSKQATCNLLCCYRYGRSLPVNIS